MKQTGTCVRGPKGDTISAVSWLDGQEIWVQITIVNGDKSMEIVLNGADALDLAQNLTITLRSVELL